MIRTLRDVTDRWRRDEAALRAAGVAYYLALSLFPVLLILTSALGAFFKWTDSGQDAREHLLQVIRDQAAPSLAVAVEQSLHQVQDYSPLSGPIGMGILVFAALAIFAQFEQAFDKIWNVTPPARQSAIAMIGRVLTSRLRAFLMLCTLGLLLIVVFVVGVTISSLQSHWRFPGSVWGWWFCELLIELTINAVALAMLYRFLPKVRVSWSAALRGGLVAGIIWELGRQLLAMLVIGQHYSSAYGVIGGFLAIMLWGYYGVAVIFFGAEWVQVLAERQMAEQPAMPKAATSHDQTEWGWSWRSLTGRAFDLSFAGLLLYVGLFLGLSHFQARQVVVVPNQPPQALVRFSDHPQLQRCVRLVFAPLIACLPSPYVYPWEVPAPSSPRTTNEQRGIVARLGSAAAR